MCCMTVCIILVLRLVVVLLSLVMRRVSGCATGVVDVRWRGRSSNLKWYYNSA